ncbi:hypothetical protein ACFVBG_36280, partial [Streptomyces fimicarius]
EQEWEGPVSAELSAAAARSVEIGARLPVWVECRCGHEWQSRARDRMTIRCPECGTGQRVPSRTHQNTGPVSERRRPVPAPRPSRPRLEPSWRSVRAPVDPREDEQPAAAPVRPSVALAGFLAALQGRNRPTPAPAAPRPAAPALTPRSAPAPAPVPVPTDTRGGGIAPIDVQQLPEPERRRRDDVCQMVRSLSAPLMVWYNTPPGLCEALDTTLPRDRQRCPGTVTHAVRFFRDLTEADAFTCAAHAGPLTATAARSAYIQASPYRIR